MLAWCCDLCGEIFDGEVIPGDENKDHRYCDLCVEFMADRYTVEDRDIKWNGMNESDDEE